MAKPAQRIIAAQMSFVLVSEVLLDLGGQFVAGGDGFFDVEADVVPGGPDGP
jgi:hypothetical protein